MVFFAYLYLPIVVLFVLSFNENSTATIWTGFTQWYGVVLGNKDIMRAATNSMSDCHRCRHGRDHCRDGWPRSACRRAVPGKDAVNGTIALPLMVPEIVTAVATLLFFATDRIPAGPDDGDPRPHRVLHPLCLPADPRPPRGHGPSPGGSRRRSLRERPGDTFRRVTLPLLWPGILSGMLAFIISLDDFVITYFVSGAGATTLPVYIFGMIRIGITPEVNAISSLMILVSVFFVTLSFILSRQKK
jgi:spermidine/putrescine transport system permease protein